MRILSILLRFLSWHDIIEMFLPNPTDRRTALWGSIAGAPIGFFGGLLIAALMAHGSQPQNANLTEGSLPSAPPVPPITITVERPSNSQPTLVRNQEIRSKSTSQVPVPTTTSLPKIIPTTIPSPIPTTGSEPSTSTTTSPPPSPQPSIQDEAPTMESHTRHSDSSEKQER